jgi:hypothetical protein
LKDGHGAEAGLVLRECGPQHEHGVDVGYPAQFGLKSSFEGARGCREACWQLRHRVVAQG